MASGTDYESRKQALEVSFHRALRWMLNRLPTFAGGLIAVLILRYFLGEPFYPMFTVVGVTALLTLVVFVGTVGGFLCTVISAKSHGKQDNPR